MTGQAFPPLTHRPGTSSTTPSDARPSPSSSLAARSNESRVAIGRLSKLTIEQGLLSQGLRSVVLRDVEEVMLALVGAAGGGEGEARGEDGEESSEQEVDEWGLTPSLSPCTSR